MTFLSDLDLGNVLFFPIDDKQSRSDGQDHVSCSRTELMMSVSTRTAFMMHGAVSTHILAPVVGPDSGTAERQSQQLVWDSSERSGQRSDEDLCRR